MHTRRFGFLLLPGFPLMSYASAVEPLRAANLLSGEKLYDWCHIGISGRNVRSSTGIEIVSDHHIGDEVALDALFICAGGNPATFRHRGTLNWLRKLARQGVTLAGMSGGTYMLARAGLLRDRKATIHWEHVPAIREEFPELTVTGSLFEFDGDRITCGGGIASLDMMLEVIENERGAKLSAAVGEWYLRTEPRAGRVSQRVALHDRYGTRNTKLLTILAKMEARIEQPMKIEQLARLVKISDRQLERLFERHLKTSPAELYRAIRLDRAQSMLRQSSLSVASIAVACGFGNAGHFSRCYRARFGHQPSREKATAGQLPGPK